MINNIMSSLKVSETKIENEYEPSNDVSNLIVPYSSFFQDELRSEFTPDDDDLNIEENEFEFKNILKKEFIDIMKDYSKKLIK